MSRKSWHLNRRSFIKGVGAACMLPYLECMGMGTLTNFYEPFAPKRLCFLSFPNGVSMSEGENSKHKEWNWFPHKTGTGYELTNSLSPLEPYRKNMSILGGLSHPNSRNVLGHMAGDTFLTGGDLRGDKYLNTISIDQIAAQKLNKYTRIPSLILSTDGGVGYKSRTSTLSFDAQGKAIPAEHRQREIFERYFSPTGGSTSIERRKSLQQDKKIVDLVLEDSKRLKKRLGANDKSKLDEYMSSLNRVEEQVKRNEKWLDVPMKEFDASHINLNVDATVDPESYLRSTMDLMILAFQTDLTRVATYMMAREDGMGFGDAFPKLALNLGGHHSMTHDRKSGYQERLGKYDQWLSKQFAYFIDRMENTFDEHGSLLDNTLILYGSPCSSTHNANNCPLILAGGSKLGVKHGSYETFDAKKIHLSNLFVSMLNAVGIETESFADSTGRLPSIIT
ncbi:hypothetical protein APS56_01020 [Pseudalgibacter alginicilyticus]|uniref:DUF1552 domain-containing protein n=1 Tax=Pseudalgibacter alginicilyticus TaxID=1736674 RepID=A0A0P0CM45_9FLAO|nr:DUF1552 domain-containing protein [Pseudalgibacter alginicilyticus]ALJ03815.1 hypothetical protein APS56_01020 [Pseudalgibacter alginicilyticus]